jgi:hypothetical protein
MTIVKSGAGTRGMRGDRWAAPVARVLRPVVIRHHRRRGDEFRGRAVLYLTTVGAQTGKHRRNAVGYELDGAVAGYQEKTDRILPVLRLTPAE